MSNHLEAEQRAGDYHHKQGAVNRPDVGLQDKFYEKRKPRTYRYDSSLDPQLSYDENYARDFGEWLLGLIERTIEEGEAAVFAEPQIWQGDSTRIGGLKAAIKLLKTLSKPFLNWSGKAERSQLSIPTVPLFIHERHSTKAILETIKHRKAKGENLDFFADQETDISERLDAYQHKGRWVNRLILGDSLHVMNSLLAYEGLGGQVQMIYMDPPYGVKFGSNFQPFVRNRNMSDKHGKDEYMTREPEMVKAYRDTWELGLHSYLTYLRDRLLLARELLTESGNVFVQISDENVHHVRDVMGEVFGVDNFIVTIPVKKKGGQKGGLLDPVNDYLLWYAKDEQLCRGKYHQLFEEAPLDAELVETFRYVELPDGREITIANLEKETKKPKGHYRNAPELIIQDFPGARIFKSENSTGGNPGKTQAVKYTFRGRVFDPGISRGLGWKHSAVSGKGDPSGMDRLAQAGRLYVGKDQIGFKRYIDDFGYKEISNWWDRLGGASDPIYAVQTNEQIVQRCVLMTTDPGDLVFDPTCGSGTTAYAAERWGRRWITCDTSRVPLALTRQRLLTRTFPYYELKDPKLGPGGGFVYKRKQSRGREVGGLVPHITSTTIANGEEPKPEVLVDRPEVVSSITRVTGPFTVEATIPPADDLAATGNHKTEEAIPCMAPSQGLT